MDLESKISTVILEQEPNGSSNIHAYIYLFLSIIMLCNYDLCTVIQPHGCKMNKTYYYVRMFAMLCVSTADDLVGVVTENT